MGPKYRRRLAVAGVLVLVGVALLVYLWWSPVAGWVPGCGVWALVLVLSFGVGWWACTRSAQALRQSDPSAIVWDEVLGIWVVLWLVTPTDGLGQVAAVGLFRLFDIAKPGPVAWADGVFKARAGEAIGARQGLGILLDDLVAALCALLVIALWRLS